MPRPTHYVLAMTLLAASAAAQVRLPGLPATGLPINGLPLQTVTQTLDQTEARSADRLTGLRHVAVGRLIRANRSVVDTDPNGDPVVRSEVLALSPTDAALEGARARGFVVDREQSIGTMGIRLVVLKAPERVSTKQALRILRDADPGGSYDYNHIYSGGGVMSARAAAPVDGARGEIPVEEHASAAAATPDAGAPTSAAATAIARGRARIGLLDTGVDITHPVFHDSIVRTWGCGGRPVPAAHGTAVASLLVGRAEVFRGVRPDAELFAADVYCGRPTGGAVDALVQAFGWLVEQKVAVINVSLVGPKNALLERVVGDLTRAGYLIVAAVGNDGPAAPPLYPASYQGVVGVTGVDSHRHVLIEAARGPQVMFASPGADLAAADNEHAYVAVRGTSFAAPIVAALLAAELPAPNASDAAAAVDALTKTAIDLGPPGRDSTYGFGLVGADYPMDPAPLIHR